jgi:cyclopropane-fatty-acyl-phospholipid synthase
VISGSIASPSETVDVTSENLAACTAGLPFAARQAFGFAIRLAAGSLLVRLPDGRAFRFSGTQAGPAAEMTVRDLNFARRLLEGGDIGIGEAYLRGEWETPDLTRFLELFCANHHLIAAMLEDRPLIRLWQNFRHWLNRNTKIGSKRNIHAHYDLGNRFYEAWLDGSMTYSAALFAEGDNDLSSAQRRKYANLAQKTSIGPDHHVLEIGCGWGGFAEFAAKEIGCKVTGLTISQEQFDYATQAHVRGRASPTRSRSSSRTTATSGALRPHRLHRDVRGRGRAVLAGLFRALSQRLRAGGRAGLQVITIQDRYFDGYKARDGLHPRYIFPAACCRRQPIMRAGGRPASPLATSTSSGTTTPGHARAWRERSAPHGPT